MSNYTLDILVRNKPVTKYLHEHNCYVEGRDGSEFTIRIKNNTARKALAILSVDGLSVMDGKEASYSSGGYVVDPFSVLKILGWRLDDDDVAKFVFGRSYASYASEKGKPKNLGVIGCAFFAEKEVASPWWYYPPSPITFDRTWDTTGLPKCAPAHTYFVRCGDVTDFTDVTSTVTFSSSTTTGLTSESEPDTVRPVQNIGTAFGPRSSFKVSNVEIDVHEKPVEVVSVYYDDREGLKARGIDLDRKVKVANPFPAQQTGCVPPKGWE